MASQHVVFAETVTAMKKARKRRAYESESDSEIDFPGNRGNKLKKKARFAHEGQLAPPSGPEVYREIVNHAGYQRAIISRNPPLLDDEGYEIDSDDDEEQIADAMNSAAEFNPYSNIRLENILAPLTAVTDLATHPTLSRPYTSKTLTELTKQGCSIMQKENAALWKVKHLQTKIIGDHNWVPCEMMVGPNDIELYDDDYTGHPQGSVRSQGNSLTLEHARDEDRPNGHDSHNGDGTSHNSNRNENTDIPMVDADTHSHEGTDAQNADPIDTEGSDQVKQHAKETDTMSQPNGSATNIDAKKTNGPTVANGVVTNGSAVTGGRETPNTQSVNASNGAVRRAGSEISGQLSVASDVATDLPIHPMFIAPRSARPDRDLGIPESEAEDMRRLLQLYVQKQEEVCRGVKRLYEGLLRADRMRKTVLAWSKYEAHVGANRDMSDGEDWYDKEEWGLDEDLKKGQEEEEDEIPQTTKKTRTRR
ncbi:hypothetical protein GGS20DRAFT_178608 [Poronia punctata]|nr:hypothetical protein GGS20DRAFT_178608 [Poronia punctata]